MSELGLGAMLTMLGGNRESAEAFRAAIGKTIARAELLKEVGDGVLRLTFDDGSAIDLYDDARSCCESRYMTTDDDLVWFEGATLTGAEQREGPTTSADDYPHETQFLVVETSRGSFTCVTHNEHNGYYGGIAIRCRAVDA